MQTLMIDMSVLVVGHQSMRNADCLVLDTNYCWLVRGLVKLNRELNIASNFILDSFYPWHVGAAQKIDHSRLEVTLIFGRLNYQDG